MLCSKSRNCHIIIVIFTLAVIWLVRPISLPTAASIPLDVQQYRQMAEVAPGLAEAIWSPFHTRILGPLLVWLMPLPVDIAYFWLNQFALVALSLTFFFLLRAYAITGQMAVLLSLAFTLNRYTHLFLAYEFYRLNDSLAMIGLWWGVLPLAPKETVVVAGSGAFGGCCCPRNCPALDTGRFADQLATPG
jgi:hypothetical protein